VVGREFGCVPEVGEIRVFNDQDAKRWYVAICEDNESWRELPHSSRDSLAAAEEASFVIQETQRGKGREQAFDPENYAWAIGNPMGHA
jgi:hypothetical protein